jgi:hypothetical protein
MPLSDPQLQGWAALPGPEVSVADTVRAFTSFAPVFGQGLDPDLAASIEAALTDIRLLGILPAAQLRLTSQT